MNITLKHRLFRIASSIPGIVLLIYLSVGCSNSSTGKRPESFRSERSVACFDYFRYTGNDDFYLDHPLENENQFYNPILPGWYSDPSICTNGEDYFLVTSTFSYFPGVPIFYSKDLVNWFQIGHILDRSVQLPLDGQRISEGIFAPAISYNPHNQTYYMITTNIRHGNFFVKTKDPFGSWSDPVWLPEVKGIDPSFFFDDDGRAYIVNNDEPDGASQYQGHRAIRVHEFDVGSEKTIGPGKMLVNGGVNIDEKPIWIEGPHLYKVNGEYFLMAAEGGTSTEHSEVIFKGTGPMGEFKPWDQNPILTQRHLDPKRPNPITCAGHADLIQTKEGDWWAVFLACRPIHGKFENLGRETFLMPVKWSDDGYPYMTRGDELIPMILEMDGVTGNHGTYGNFEIKDEFNDTILDLQWMTLRSPAKDLYSLSDQAGYLSLKCSENKASESGTPALIARRIQHHRFECTTKMIFDPSENDAAGLLLLKDENHQYFLYVSKSSRNREINLIKITRSGSEKLAAKTIKGGLHPVELKVISEGTTFEFCYSLKDDTWETLCEDISAHYLSTDNSFGFTGTTIGMYATKDLAYDQETAQSGI
ncbi:MAG: glycoside hydrolase family 43 protein [Bacteroidales bacterium]|nr:glycoside hydrolase family 43 protein [Bacteroidales bacterium]MBN2698876.1 glycoside hydrolase family 43 protein [Bacteroidales bacterium]